MKKYNNVPGNYEDKYNAKNPISKFLVSGFLNKFLNNLEYVGSPSRILDIGAGEGYMTTKLASVFPDAEIIAGDLEDTVNTLARKATAIKKNINIKKLDVRKIDQKDHINDLVVCMEVLEHVPAPEKALYEIIRVMKNGGYCLLSVPNEPIWRILNMMRGSYLKTLGNTPGHLNHWSSSMFVQFVKSNGRLGVVRVNSPFPWTMLVARKIQ